MSTSGTALASLGAIPNNRQEAVLNLRFPILGLVLSLVYGHAFELTADWPILRTTPNSGIQLQPAQVGDLPGEATLMQMRLAALIEEKNWEEAIAAFFKLIDRYGDLSIAIGDESNRYLSVATYGHMLLADLPPEAIALYRDRVDAAAGDWYRGLRTVTNPTSEQVGQLDQFFCSRYGDDALLLLGDRALERGHFDQAREYWQRIHASWTAEGGLGFWHAYQGIPPEQLIESLQSKRPTLQDASRDRHDLFYPDSDLDLATVGARLVLASILQRDLSRAEWELSVFRGLFPEAQGWLAGKDNVYADTLEQLLAEQSEREQITRQKNIDQSIEQQRESQQTWPTFAGSPTRNRLFYRAVDFSPVPLWEWSYARVMPAVELPHRENRETQNSQNARAATNRSDDLYFYPLIVRNWALLKNSSQIFALNIGNGQPAFEGSQFGQIYPQGELVSREVKRDARNHLAADPWLPPQYSMTFFEGRLLARMGTQLTSRAVGFDSGYAGNRITCLDLDREGALEWNFPSKDEEREFDREKWSFEGPPLADRNGVYVVMRRGAMQAISYVACLDLQTGKLRWRQEVCRANTPAGGVRNEITHTLLTLSEGHLYLNTNLGAVASLRTQDGKLRWAYRYVRAQADAGTNLPSHFRRGLNPCVVVRGVVVVAPRDSASLMAFDAHTGQLLWKSAPMTSSPIHILGVAGDMVLATGENLWWFNMVTGRAHAVWPQPGNRGGPRGYGKGILAGGRVYWPTRDAVFVFDQRLVDNGDRSYPLQRGIIPLKRPDLPDGNQAESGNLVAGGGFCLIAGKNRLQAFPLPPLEAKPNPENRN
ncbi:MAG: PQQ-binding-like beta-propeller repeat protein [Planctomycetota bacterium]|nr:PQQ-binding-like beta-propeller repeat protein [Planctomycetota bacterium]